MKVVNEKMVQNEKNAGLNPTAAGDFYKSAGEGVVIKAVFDEKSILEEALIVDERKELKVKITRYLDEVTFALSWRGFSVKLTKGFGTSLPGILYKDVFVNEFKSPIEYYKVLLNLIEMSIDKEYEKAQNEFELEQKENEE